MTLDEMIELKSKLGYSYELISEKSGIPISTVQKVFGGATASPRFKTLQALSKAFEGNEGYLSASNGSKPFMVKEPSAIYGVTEGSSALKYGDNTGKTLADYLALPDDVRVELIDGVFYDMSSPTSVHQLIGSNVYTFLDRYINDNYGECIAFVAPTDVQLDCDDKTIVEPDVFVVCDRSKITKPRIVGAPDLIVEVLSPSNWYHDMVRKLNKYKNAGVREYWILMPDEKTVQVYIFEKGEGPIFYTFEDKVPVGIWQGKAEVDFKSIYDRISFLY